MTTPPPLDPGGTHIEQLAAELLALVQQPVLPRGSEITRERWQVKVKAKLAEVFRLGQSVGFEKATGTGDSTVFVTYDGDTHWLECYADDPDDAEHGQIIHPIGAGDNWSVLAAKYRSARRPESGPARGPK